MTNEWVENHSTCDKLNRLYIFPIKTGAEKMTREIVLDTETTGLDPNKGDRVVEIGCVELVRGFPTDESVFVDTLDFIP